MADESRPRSRFLPGLILSVMVASALGWLILLYVTRPLAPPEADVIAALEGLPSSVQAEERITLASGKVLNVTAGLDPGATPSIDYVGGVVILRYPSVEFLPKPAGNDSLSGKGAMAVVDHAEGALRREIQGRIQTLGYDAEVHFGPEE